MQKYNNRLTARDLFMNSAMSGVFPQFSDAKLQNVYSFAEVEKRVQNYLAAALNGTVSGDGELTVNGNYNKVLEQVRQLKPMIETFFNNTPKVAQAIRKNTPFYLPYATKNQLERIKSTENKTKAMREVLDNLQYNESFGALNSIKNEPSEKFARNRKKWEAKVGYRRLKKV